MIPKSIIVLLKEVREHLPLQRYAYDGRNERNVGIETLEIFEEEQWRRNPNIEKPDEQSLQAALSQAFQDKMNVAKLLVIIIEDLENLDSMGAKK